MTGQFATNDGDSASLRECARHGAWFFVGLPELRLFPSAVERRRSMHVFRHMAGRSRAFWYWLVLFATFYFFKDWVIVGYSWPWWLEQVIGFVGVIGAAAYLMWRLRPEAQRRLRASLIECAVPVCVGCGYYLRGLVSDRCPECGREIEPHVAKLIRSSTDIGQA